MSLTPQQKAARTRAANRAKEEQAALAVQNSIKGPRSAKTSALDEQPWLGESRKRAAAEPSQSARAKVPKLASSDTSKSKSTPQQYPPPSKGPAPEVDSRPRPLQASVALAKAPQPAPPRYEGHDEQSQSDNEDSSQDPNQFEEEEVEQDEDVNGEQLMSEATQWVPEDDADRVHHSHGRHMAIDFSDYDDTSYAYRRHSRSSSVSSGFDIHVPTSASEREDDFEDDQVSENMARRHRRADWEQPPPPRRPQRVMSSDDEDHAPLKRISHTRPSSAISDDENQEIQPLHEHRQPTKSGSRHEFQLQHQLGRDVDRDLRREDRREPHHQVQPVSQRGSRREHQLEPHRQPQQPREREPRYQYQLESRHQAQPQMKAAKSKSSDTFRQAGEQTIYREIPTTRKEKAMREQPSWAMETASGSERPGGHPRRSAARAIKAAVALSPTSSGWPDTPALVFTGRGVLNLGSQNPLIQTLIRTSFTKIIGDALFRHAFPDIGDRLQYARDGLYATCQKLGYEAISERLLDDEAYSKEIAKVADGRWTDTRRSFKAAAIPATIHSFDLKVGCSQRVQTLITSPHTDYIYPLKDGVPDYKKPFGNPAIITTIHQAAFSGRRPLATTYQARFPLTNGPQSERMVGKVIAALAATAVCATLQEWQGPQHVSNEFNANLFAETYLMHITFLERMEDQSPVAYQKVLARLYREASGQGKVIAPRAATGANVLAHLNFADIEAASD
ncbi:hypothetical protein C8R44DRAFT_370642 [Mycena epipterygia]|nr:hypothetical protein C8R44DRAFT_370642 [Mycena epipterygia]